jgi:hypothetical protein
MAEGQFTGQKARYVYVADDGREFNRTGDVTLGSLAGTANAVSGATAAADGALPRRFKPRGVYWQGVLDGRIVRKFLICGTQEAPLYVSVNRTALTVDGVAGQVVGRRGEQVTF